MGQGSSVRPTKVKPPNSTFFRFFLSCSLSLPLLFWRPGTSPASCIIKPFIYSLLTDATSRTRTDYRLFFKPQGKFSFCGGLIYSTESFVTVRPNRATWWKGGRGHSSIILLKGSILSVEIDQKIHPRTICGTGALAVNAPLNFMCYSIFKFMTSQIPNCISLLRLCGEAQRGTYQCICHALTVCYSVMHNILCGQNNSY